MNVLADIAATPSFATAAAEAPSTASSPAMREVYRLADALLPLFSPDRARCFLLLDCGGGPDSFWLATAVGSALGVTLKSALHVLSIDPSLSREGRPSKQALSGEGCVVETLHRSLRSGDRGSLGERLSELRTADTPVLLHASQEALLPEGLLQSSAISGVVLLARAARTRRAALQATVRRMTLTGVPLLGCVLLDRTHPIPERLYRLL